METSPPVKVMRIIARLNVGGPALHCTMLSRSLTDHGFHTTLVTGTPEGEEESFEKLFGFRPEGFEFVRLRGLRRTVRMLGDLRTLGELITLMRRERPQIVHTHTAKAGLLGRIAAAVTGVPVVVHTFHGHVLSGYFSAPFSWLIRQLERGLALRTTAIVTLSSGLKEELSGKFRIAPPSKFRVIPLGRPLSEFFAADALKGRLRAELGLRDPSTRLVGTVGRLVPIKDQRTLLQAFAQLRLPHPCHLVIAGEGELAPELQALATELGVRERVHFLGWRADLPTIYADLDVFALSSLNEGTPLSIIEAFAAGCPVASTRVGGVADMFSPGEAGAGEIDARAEGVLVPPARPELLARALEILLADPELRARSGRAARSSAGEYTSERLTHRIAELYRELIRQREARC